MLFIIVFQGAFKVKLGDFFLASFCVQSEILDEQVTDWQTYYNTRLDGHIGL